MRIIFALLFATVVMADPYTVIFIDNTISQDSVTLILNNVKDIGVDVGIIDQAQMPIWWSKADTNITGKVLCVRTDSLGVNEWKDMPLPYVETRVTKHVRPPYKQKVKVITRADLVADYDTNKELP